MSPDFCPSRRIEDVDGGGDGFVCIVFDADIGGFGRLERQFDSWELGVVACIDIDGGAWRVVGMCRVNRHFSGR